MAKIKSQFPVGNFYLRVNKEGKGVVRIRYFINGRYVHKSTSIEVDVKMWDNKGQKIKNSTNPRLNSLYNQKNLMLQEFKNNIDQQIRSYEGLLTYEVVSQIVNGNLSTKKQQIKSIDFVEYCKEICNNKYEQRKVSYSYKYNKSLAIDQFREFFKAKYGKSVISICDISSKLFEDYKTYRFNKRGNCAESINKCLAPLFDGIKSLYENGFLDPVVYASIYNKYVSTKKTIYNPIVEDKTIRYLTPEQLNEFVNVYRQTRRQRTYEIMQMFLFSVNTGLRISDIVTLEWNHINITKKVLKKNMVKTKEVIEIHLNKSAMDILNQWKRYNRNQRFVFDLMKEDADLTNPDFLFKKIASKNRIIQTSLHAIGEKMNLPFNLSFHCARHTFAVLALRQNKNLYTVSKLLGHTSIRATEKTYAEFLPDDYKKISLETIDFGIAI
jgi:integrase